LNTYSAPSEICENRSSLSQIFMSETSSDEAGTPAFLSKNAAAMPINAAACSISSAISANAHLGFSPELKTAAVLVGNIFELPALTAAAVLCCKLSVLTAAYALFDVFPVTAAVALSGVFPALPAATVLEGNVFALTAATVLCGKLSALTIATVLFGKFHM